MISTMKIGQILQYALLLAFVFTQSPAFGAEDGDKTHLDGLFDKLALAADQAEALSLEQSIYEVWTTSGSDTVDLLLDRATMAVSVKEMDLAWDLLKRLEETKPDFAPVFFLRAQISLQEDDYAAAMVDLEQTLKLEPRQFDAISELGHILHQTGNKSRALKAYRMALDVHPFLSDIQKRVDTLEKELEGNDI